MAGTMEGLGVPLFGGYTSYQSNGTTSFLTVNSDGTHDFTFTNEGTDNFISVTITDATTITSGYIQPFYTSLAVTGAYSTGSCQINAFAADISLSGTPGVEVSGMYLYFSETGTTTVTSLNLAGHTVYFEDMGGAPVARAGFKVYSAGTNVASQFDAAFMFISAGTGTMSSLLGFKGASDPEYFLSYVNAPSAGRMMADYSPSDAATKALRVNLAGTIYNIPMVADSCS